MDLSLTTVYVFSHSEVIVKLDDGCIWILERHQLGVQNIFALPLTELAVEQLNPVKGILGVIIVVNGMNNSLQFVTSHVH